MDHIAYCIFHSENFVSEINFYNFIIKLYSNEMLLVYLCEFICVDSVVICPYLRMSYAFAWKTFHMSWLWLRVTMQRRSYVHCASASVLHMYMVYYTCLFISHQTPVKTTIHLNCFRGYSTAKLNYVGRPNATTVRYIGIYVCVVVIYEILDDESPQRWSMLKNDIRCNSNLFSILIEIIATANAISSDHAFIVQHWEKLLQNRCQK